MIKKYRKKPVVVEVVQWTGDNIDEVLEFGQGKIKYINGKPTIETLEGTLTASKNDYIIKGIKGEYYPCKPDVFANTYEEVDELLEK